MLFVYSGALKTWRKRKKKKKGKPRVKNSESLRLEISEK